MTAIEKRKEEQEELLQSRKYRILQAAFDLFAENGIDTIAMTDIAKKAEIGVASLYRYYETKEEIAIRTSIWAWQQMKAVVMTELNKNNFAELSGFLQLDKICSIFTLLCKDHRKFLSFIYFFDSFAIRQHIETERMNDYENEISFVKDFVVNAIDKGLKDNTLKEKYKGQENLLYFTLMHTLFSTAQKLSLSGSMLEMDKVISVEEQMDFLKNLILSEIKN